MQPIQLFDPATSTYTYLLADAASGDALIIDPVDAHLQRDLALLAERGLRLRWTLETHTHADHITSAARLAEHTGARVAAPAGCGVGTAAVQLKDGDLLAFGGETLQALHTPGHTAGSMCYLWRDHVFTGDTLLIGGCGRTDFQSGSAAALYRSITERLFALPPATTVWPGHDYHGRSHSTLGHEAQTNPRIAGKTQAEFEATMNALNLPTPQRLHEAVPANQHSGLVPHEAGAALDAPRPATGYAGDVSPALAHAWWQAGSAVLVDIRSDAERAWVGFIPDVPGIEWKVWPGMALNPQFDAQLQAAAPAGSKLLLLCRSGIRSIAAAQRAQALGFEAYNILEGFEGDPDGAAHRGLVGGWRHRGLPWKQS